MHFIDTTVLVGGGDRKDQLHPEAKEILKKIPGGQHGVGLVSDLVLAETATILSRRRGPKEAAAYVKGFRDSPSIRCVFLDGTLFDAALVVFSRYGNRLSFTDSATVAIMESLGCRILFSHDSGFDGIPNVTRRTAV